MTHSLENWLKDIELTLREGIIESRFFKAYIYNIKCKPGPIYITKNIGKAISEIEWTVPKQPFVTTFKMVIPSSVNIQKRGEWVRWYQEKIIIDKYINSIRKEISGKEHEIVLNMMMKDLEELEINVCNLNELRPAIELVQSYNHSADTLLINYTKINTLSSDRKFHHATNYGQEFLQEKGKGFIGMFGQLSTYATIGIPEDTGIVYDKYSSHLWMTPLEANFDNYSKPRILQVNEDIYAWIEDDGAAVKIYFKTN